MKKILTVSALAIAALVYSQPGQAQHEGRWCAKIDQGGGTVGERCDFPSFATCRNHIRGESRSFCVHNPMYVPYWVGEEGSGVVTRRYR